MIHRLVARVVQFPAAFASALLAAWTIPWIAKGYSARIDGQRYFWLADDPMISLRYARNLAHGLGLVWNPGERIEGYSNFLWTVLMAPLQLLPISDSKQALPALIANLLFALGGLVILRRIAMRLHADPTFTTIVVLACAVNGTVFEWMIRGFETPLLIALLLLAFERVLSDLEEGKSRLTTYLATMLPALVRFDALLLCGMLAGWAILKSRRRRQAIAYCLIALAIPLGHTVFRLAYYGDWLPNTAYLKAFGWPGKTKRGIRYVFEFCETYPLLVIGAGAAMVWSRQTAARAAAMGCAVLGLYVAYVGGDFFKEFRFLAPAVPFMLLSVLSLVWERSEADTSGHLQNAMDRRFGARAWQPVLLLLGPAVALGATYLWWRQEYRTSHAANLLAMVAAIGLGLGTFAAFAWRNRGVQGVAIARQLANNPLRMALLVLVLAGTRTVLSSHRVAKPFKPYVGNIRIANYLRDHTPPFAKVADIWAGAVFYYSGRPGIDLLGKCDRYVARQKANPVSSYPGHNKFDYDYSLGRLRPDFVVSSFKLPVTDQAMRETSTGDLAFIGSLYFNSVFRRHCLPHPVPVDTWRTIFWCDWSNEPPSGFETPSL